MKTSNISKISASIPNTKKAKFNLSHDNNTTYDWGSVQPLMSKMMLPDSSININMEQLTRLAPMVVPTFGRVKLKNIAHFIPMQEIYPNWDAMMTQTKVSRTSVNSGTPSASVYVPKNVPYVNNNILAAYCLAGAKINFYFSGVVGSTTENVWYCARNTGTWNTPAGWASATTATRDYLNILLGIANSQIPNSLTLTPWRYTGSYIGLSKILLNKNGSRIFTSTANFTRIPSISTMIENPLPNANGTGYTHSASNEQNSYDTNIGDSHISFDGADMIWEYAGSTGNGISSNDRAANSGTPVEGVSTNEFDSCKIRLVFKLSSFGKRLRKILIGLGYDVNLANDDKVSILPLIAYYKAWWDSFAPERYKNFYETAAWKIIQASMAGANGADIVTYLNNSSSTDLRLYWPEFIANLGTCFATEKIDAISAATDNYYAGNNTTNGSNGTDIQQAINNTLTNTILENDKYTYGTDNYGATGSINTRLETHNGYTANEEMNQIDLSFDNNYMDLTQPQIDALKKAYIMLNKCSVAGMKVEEILRALGFGDYVEECKGKFINANDNSIKISDVVATAATDDAKLGQYGGRGLGVGNFQFSFKTNRHGYMIILSCIVPESGYVNAPVHENEAISFNTMYNPELDGLAYEAIQKKNLAGSPLINDPSYSDTFGFLPTYSQWKFMSNKANGDFSLNSMKNSLTPYTLDKYIPVSDTNVYKTEEVVGHNGSMVEICSPNFKYSDLPNAGEDYRYINKFPWNGNYNRIFAAEGDGYEWSVFSQNNNQFLYNSFEYDNFLVHNVFNIAYFAHMKSIENSYGTYDEEHGAPNSTITRS